MDRFRRNFAGWEGLMTPEVFWDYTAPGVLTMERAEGLRLKDATENLELHLVKKGHNDSIDSEAERLLNIDAILNENNIDEELENQDGKTQ